MQKTHTTRCIIGFNFLLPQGSQSVNCSSAWLSKAGEDFGVRKINQDSALALGNYSTGDGLFGVFDGHGPYGAAFWSCVKMVLARSEHTGIDCKEAIITFIVIAGHLVSQHVRNHMPDVLKKHLKVANPRQALIAGDPPQRHAQSFTFFVFTRNSHTP